MSYSLAYDVKILAETVLVHKHTIISLKTSPSNLKIKAIKKGKVISLQARCGPEGGYRYNSTLP